MAAAVEEEYEDRAITQLPLGPALDDGEAKAQIQARKSAVEKAVTAGDSAKALELAISEPPYGASPQMKVLCSPVTVFLFSDILFQLMNAEVVARALGAIKEKDIDAAVQKLTPEQADVVMKYVFKLMDVGDATTYGSLLKWHAALTTQFGLGVISRVFADSPAL